MHTRKPLYELSINDQGKTVSITGGEASITGVLVSFEVESEWLDITEMGEEGPNQIRGYRSVTINVGHWTACNLSPETVIEVFE